MHARATLEILELADTGEGVAFWERALVLVPQAFPGERVTVALTRHAGAWLGQVLSIERPGPGRRVAPCVYAGHCGGCEWMALGESAQWSAKTQRLRRLLRDLPLEALDEYCEVPAPSCLGARVRAQLHFGPEGLGFYRSHSTQVLAVKRCLALKPQLADLPGLLGARFGRWRGLISSVRLLGLGRAASAALELKGPPPAGLRSEAEALVAGGVLCGVRLHGGDFPSLDIGQANLEDGVLSAAPDGFWQADEAANATLRQLTARWLQGRDGPVLELYAGGGNFTQALEGPGRSVLAVESSLPAVERGRKALTGRHVRWIHGEVQRVVDGLISEGADFNGVFLDPPRAGCPQLGGWLSHLKPDWVLYVACEPASLIRDLRKVLPLGYVPRRIAILDAFPQTHHFETLVFLARSRAHA